MTAHAAVAAAADPGMEAQAAIDDWRTAAVPEELRKTLEFLEKLTQRPAEVGGEDVRALLAAGVSREAIEDAVYLCAVYSVIDRVADAFGFALPGTEEMRRTSRFLLKIGYRI